MKDINAVYPFLETVVYHIVDVKDLCWFKILYANNCFVLIMNRIADELIRAYGLHHILFPGFGSSIISSVERPSINGEVLGWIWHGSFMCGDWSFDDKCLVSSLFFSSSKLVSSSYVCFLWLLIHDAYYWRQPLITLFYPILQQQCLYS